MPGLSGSWVFGGKVTRTAAKRGPEAPQQHSSSRGGMPGVDGGFVGRAVAEAGVHDAEPAATEDADRLWVAFAAVASAW
ncbi:hypothetical protein GCM10027176_41160 [Actinoallomurus bryophytorum]